MSSSTRVKEQPANQAKLSNDTSKAPTDPKQQLETMIQIYFNRDPSTIVERQAHELEVSFGTLRNGKSITKMDYDRVVKHLYSQGFQTANPRGVHMLRIKEEYVDSKTGENRISNIRAEIMGVDLIQEYCRTNSIQKILDMPSTLYAKHEKLKFTQKTPSFYPKTTFPIKAIQFSDLNFNVKYQMERDFSVNSVVAKNIIGKWTDTRKIFRHMNRVQFRHPEYPVFVDISIVCSSKNVGRTQMPQYTIQEAGVFENDETYEIELELDNSQIGAKMPVYNTYEKVIECVRHCIRMVLGALQDTPYPIGKNEQNTIIQEYMKTIHGDGYEPRRVNPKDFVGPSSVTLSVEHIAPITDKLVGPNIRTGYCVTEKADGERKLLYIGNNQRIYLIDTNMNVQFTGMVTDKTELTQTILDGEHIMYNKKGEIINLYAPFDIYYLHGKSFRELPFMVTSEEMIEHKFRLGLLYRCTTHINPQSVVKKAANERSTKEDYLQCSAPLKIKCKRFFVPNESFTIFQACAQLLFETIYEYNTDGLIFTPIHYGVAGDAIGKTGHLFKPRWNHSFKWKPAKYNTIDFLVSSSRDIDGKDEIHTILPDGVEMNRAQTITQYKVIHLKCGYSIKDHGFLNPFQDVIEGKIPREQDTTRENEYLPVQFQPTNPYDPKAHICYVPLLRDGTNALYMQTEEGEYFEEGMIVEFKYNLGKTGGWRWVPLRVRYDKTAELRSGSRNFGNSYDVANSNWTSIHHPITEEMISTGKHIPEYTGDSDVYYNLSTRTVYDTKSLKDFHNLYVKRKLITGVSKTRDTLIDLAVGKAGDLSKWVSANLSFVFGIDISKDNIQNKKDGACARYLNTRKKFPKAMNAIFLHGNSGLNIRNGDAFATDKEKRIAKAIFGNGPKDRNVLEEGVFRNHGIGLEGFQICSCQFALHYFFENAKTLHSFLRNIADCTATGGYFIGTCYDGKKVFKLLSSKWQGEPHIIQHNGHKIFEITKQYEESGFPENELSLGYPIDIYQESINKTFREYLVNMDYFVRLMDDYGFVPVPKTEAIKMGLPNGIGSFETMFIDMENEINRYGNVADEYGTARNMSEDEKFISFLNIFFVFRKVRVVDTSKISQVFHLDEAEDQGYYSGVDDDEIGNISKRTNKLLTKASKHVTFMDETGEPGSDKKPHFIRKMDYPKITIGKYESPSETSTHDELSIRLERAKNDEANYPAPNIPSEDEPDADADAELPVVVFREDVPQKELGAIEITATEPTKVKRGEIKRAIRVPKTKIRINT
jgi:mRNA (guanine-N7-)-methyltransferase